MIYTSYFSSRKWELSKGISIARYVKFWEGETYPLLFPSQNLLSDYKNGLINEKEYERRYVYETLSKLNPKEVYEALDGKVLLCYEKTGDFCHRHIVAKWLIDNGFKCEEL